MSTEENPTDRFLPEGDRPAAGGEDLAALLSSVALVGAETGELRARTATLTDQVTGLSAQVEKLAGRMVDASHLAQIRGELDRLVDLAEVVAELSETVNELAKEETPNTFRPVDWAHLPDTDREEILQDLVAWVRDVLFDGWPSAQQRIPECWPHHRELINEMLWARTSYQVAYDNPHGHARDAGDFRRALDDAIDRATEVTRGCQRPDDGHLVPLPPRDDTEALQAAARTDIIGQIFTLTRQGNDLGVSEEIRAVAREQASALVAEHDIGATQFQQYQVARRLSEDHAQAPAARTRRSDS